MKREDRHKSGILICDKPMTGVYYMINSTEQHITAGNQLKIDASSADATKLCVAARLKH